MLLHLINRSGYTSESLRRFFERGLRACLPRRRGTLVLVVVTAPERSRGCATVGGNRMTIAIASPSRFRLRRLALVFEHEYDHIFGTEHAQMSTPRLYSLGKTPEWARGSKLVYVGRAPVQSGRVPAS